MQDLGAPGDSIAYGVSADGSVVVGVSNNRAFRWTTPSVIEDLGVLQGASWSAAYDVSANGSVVVGDSGRRGFRWTEAGGMQPIDRNPESSVRAVSADGLVAVGSVPGYNQRLFAYRWNADGSATNLSIWSSDRAVALGVSPNGAVAVGWGSRGDDSWRQRAWAWLGQFGGVQLPSQSDAFAHAVSGNGVIVGRNYSWRAIRWVYCNGRYVEQDLNTVYSSLLSSRSFLSVAYAISPNGRYIVGQGYNAATGRYEAYLLDTCGHNGDVDGNGCVDDADLLRVLFAFGGTSTVCDPKREDVNCDGVIDDADLLIVLFNFGTGC
jgi:probable HAF family extracellular repeat protein